MTASGLAASSFEQSLKLPDHVGQLSALASQRFELTPVSTSQAYVTLQNASSFEARFLMRFNGNLSVNIQDLAAQIRASESPAGDVPDFEKAYYYLREHHAHDFPLSTRTWTHEPSLYLNSLGAGLCDDAATALSMIWDAMGYESRIWLLNGHVVSEVFTGARWQMYDADLQVHYFNRDGLVAGVEELSEQPNLIRQPTNPISSDAYVYRGRIAQIYATSDNNRICTACSQHTVARDLVFAIPAGGSLRWGDDTIDKTIPKTHLNSPQKLSTLTITIPSGSRGELDIPLALYDVRGAGSDQVWLADRAMQLDANAVFDFLNTDRRTGNRIQAISFADNRHPIEVRYFFNREFAAVRAENQLEIRQLTATSADLHVSVDVIDRSQTWQFATSRRRSTAFHHQRHVDLSNNSAASLFDGRSPFALEATVKLNAEVGQRRPIVDAFRFALEIDAHNRPYVYYRDQQHRWVGLRGAALPAGEWHQLSVTYDAGKLSLFTNGQLVGSRAGAELSSNYPLRGPYLGKSDHMGGMYFSGDIQDVSLFELPPGQ